MRSVKEELEKLAPHRDRYDLVFAGVLGLVIGITVFWSPLTGSHAIAMVTAVTALVGIYQLRHPTDTVRPAVREDFHEDGEDVDFGLRNYGPGPALYLQLVAKIGGDRQVELKPQDPPIHLQEGDFVGLQYDSRSAGELWGDSASPDDSMKEVQLYYSYVTEQGLREPVSLNVSEYTDTQCLFEEMSENEDPRTIDLETVKQSCTEKATMDSR